MSYTMIIIGAVLLGVGIIFNHFFANKWWIALIIAGVILLIVGLIYVLIPGVPSLPSDFILPVLHN